MGGDGHTKKEVGLHGRHWGGVGTLARWTSVEPGWLDGYDIGGTGS
jgi:hypothetical protein